MLQHTSQVQEIAQKLKVDRSAVKKVAENRARALISSIKSNPNNASVYANEIRMLNYAYGLPESVMAELAQLEQNLEIKKNINLEYVDTQTQAQSDGYHRDIALISIGLGLAEEKLGDVNARLDNLAIQIGTSMNKAEDIRKRRRKETSEVAIAKLEEEYKTVVVEVCVASSTIYADIVAILEVVKDLETKLAAATSKAPEGHHHNSKELSERLAHIKGHLKQTEEKFNQVVEPVKEEIAAYYIEKRVLDKNKNASQEEKDRLVENALKAGLNLEQMKAVDEYVLGVSRESGKARIIEFDNLMTELNSLEMSKFKHVDKILNERQSGSQDIGLKV